MTFESDRPLRVKVYDREHPSQPLGQLIGEFQLNGDFQAEHIAWALLADEDAEYLPNHVTERREWSMSWGAGASGVDIIIEVMNNPYISGVLGSLVYQGLSTATRRIMERIRSAPITEEEAIRHARQWVTISGTSSAVDWTVAASGHYAHGARWVELQSASMKYRIGVALTSKGGVSVATEHWERIAPTSA